MRHVKITLVFEKQDKVLKLRMVYYSVSGHGQTQKKEIRALLSGVKPKTSLIIRSDALSPSYKRLVGAKAIKLDSWDKQPVYCADWNVMCGICAME